MADRTPEMGAGQDKGLLILIGCFLGAFLFLFKPWVHGFDTVAYYSWLRTAVIDRNLEVGDEFAYFGYGTERGRSPTGHTYNEWAVGCAVLWSPFFLLAHTVSLLAQSLGLPVSADGYGTQYVWAVSLGSTLYAFVGLILTYRLCRNVFPSSICTLATLAVWLSSPLVFYMYSHPLMSHANDAFAYALYLYTWQRTRESPSPYSALLRGATAGLCALIRQVNAVLVFFPLLEFIGEGIRAWHSTRSLRVWKYAVLKGALFSVAWWVVYTPQLIVWRVVFGHWVELNPYATGAGVGFDWLHPQFLGVLFSTNRGLFVWSPLLMFSVLGWGYLRRQDCRLTSLIATSFILQLSVISAWQAWSGGAAFGQRFFTNLVPAFIPGLAALLFYLRQRKVSFRWLVAGCAGFIVWNGLLMVRYVLEDVPRMGPVPLDQLLVGQFTVLPRHFLRILEILLKRS